MNRYQDALKENAVSSIKNKTAKSKRENQKADFLGARGREQGGGLALCTTRLDCLSKDRGRRICFLEEKSDGDVPEAWGGQRT